MLISKHEFSIIELYKCKNLHTRDESD